MIEVTYSLSTGEFKGWRDLGDSPKDEVAFDGLVTFFARRGLELLETENKDGSLQEGKEGEADE